MDWPDACRIDPTVALAPARADQSSGRPILFVQMLFIHICPFITKDKETDFVLFLSRPSFLYVYSYMTWCDDYMDTIIPCRCSISGVWRWRPFL